jgi:hypothetical protein
MKYDGIVASYKPPLGKEAFLNLKQSRGLASGITANHATLLFEFYRVMASGKFKMIRDTDLFSA